MKILKIKLLTAPQVSEIVALDRICIGGLWTAEAYLREIDSPRSTLLALYYADDNASQSQYEMIGMGCLWAIVEEAHITLLGIHPNHRRQGLGELLLLTLFEDAIARQLEWATLEVNVNNLAGIGLYKKFGFQVAGIRKGYYQPAGEDASILWLKGLQQPEFKSNLSQWQHKLRARLSKNHYYLH
ncbi:MAG TPA: N-acetyltransferase [Coleofasciculaceae cyanobacterium]